MLPHCAEHFFAGMRVAAPLSVIGAIVAEFNGADAGVGKDIFISAKRPGARTYDERGYSLAPFCLE